MELSVLVTQRIPGAAPVPPTAPSGNEGSNEGDGFLMTKPLNLRLVSIPRLAVWLV